MNPLGKTTYDDARVNVVSLGVDLSHRGTTFNRHSPKRVEVGSNRFLEFVSESIKLDSCARYLKSAIYVTRLFIDVALPDSNVTVRGPLLHKDYLIWHAFINK